MTPRLMTPAAAARALGISRQAVEARMSAANPSLTVIVVARTRLVTRTSVERVKAEKDAIRAALQ